MSVGVLYYTIVYNGALINVYVCIGDAYKMIRERKFKMEIKFGTN